MKTKQIINYEEALKEKRQAQKIYFEEHGYPSSVSTLIIAYFEERNEKK